MTTLLDGKALANKINEDLKERISTIEGTPHLVAVQIGNVPESDVYIKHKQDKANEIGIKFTHLKFEQEITEEKLVEEISKLNEDKSVDGIMVQLPLPEHIDTNNVGMAIDPIKDVDGFHPLNKGLLDIDETDLVPPTAWGVIALLDEYEIDVKGKVVTIIGQGEIAGKPISKLMNHRGATSIICNEFTEDLAYFTRQSDVVISAVGYKHLVKADYIKEGSVVINIGFTREEDEIFGDVEFETIKEKTSFITPITGGTGPMTVSILLENTLISHELNNLEEE